MAIWLGPFGFSLEAALMRDRMRTATGYVDASLYALIGP
jgi:hypothetical protein